MARIYPNKLQRAGQNGRSISSAETTLYTLFRDQLDSDYTVFHSVAWQNLGDDGRVRDGETDFIIAHPQDGILVLEVKGGAINFNPQRGEWTSIDRFGGYHVVKDPFDQARRSKYALIGQLRRSLGRARHINVGHAVAFPDAYVPQSLGPDKPTDIILGTAQMGDIGNWVRTTMAYWRGKANPRRSRPGEDAMQALMRLLGKNRALRPALWGEFQREQSQMIQLTEEQYTVLDMLHRQRRAAISGCAGSGKTLLATEKAVRLAEQGFDVLLTCYNKNLAQALQRQLGDRPHLTVTSFHKLCFDVAREANLLPIKDVDQRTFYGQKLPAALTAATQKLGARFDAVIVDEGQDFKQNWWSALESQLRDGTTGIFYVFYDDNQRIYKNGRAQSLTSPSTFPIQTPPFTLTVNCRNTVAIHQQVRRFYSAETPVSARGPAGRPVDISRFEDEDTLLATLTDTIKRLTRDEHIPANEIAILTPLSRRKSRLWSTDGFRGVRYTDTWPPAPEQIHCNTIHAFKGLESSVIILAEVDRYSSRPKDLDPLLYVACSRAKNHLVVLLPDNAPSSLRHRFS